MDKKTGLKVFFKKPIEVIKSGMRVQEQVYNKEYLEKTYNVSQLKSISILDLLGDIDESIENYTFLTGTSKITDLMLLKALAKSMTDCEYLEIGSWRGESLVNVSPVAKSCTSVTLSSEDLKKLNVSDNFIKVHGIFSKDLKNVKEIKADSHVFDFNSLNQKFDLIFVDGDHSYKGVLNDTKKVFNLRKDKKSVIVWHDYGNDTEYVRHTTLRAIMDGIPKEHHKNLYHVSNTMCAIYIEDSKLDTTDTQFPTFPDKVFDIKIKSRKL